MKKLLKNFMILFLGGCVLAGCALVQEDDVAFARRFWKLFCDGDYAAAAMIDWSKANFFAQDVATQYNALPSRSIKESYEKNLIDSFSQGYKYMMTMYKNIRVFNWRMVKDDPKIKVVGVNVVDLSRTFFFYVSHEGLNRKIVGVQGVAPGYDPEQAVKILGLLEQSENPERFLNTAQQFNPSSGVPGQGGQNITSR